MGSLSQCGVTWHYQSFMLRLWRESPDAPYRASLQATSDGEPLLFCDLAALFNFLNHLDQADSPAPNNDDDVISPFSR